MLSMKYEILRAATCSPELKIADLAFNEQKIIDAVYKAEEENIQLLVFPELCITGYTCADLFLQSLMQQKAKNSLISIAKKTQNTNVLFTLGLPLSVNDSLYNVAVFIQKGKIICIIPKTYIPNYSEFYECRWFTPFTEDKAGEVNISEEYLNIPFGSDIILQDKNDSLIKIACEICEDAWVPLSPATRHALTGATIITNLSASNEIVGKAQYRRLLISSTSAKNICAYIYANASHDESSTDMIFSSHNLIALNGTILAENKPFENKSSFTVTDLDLERIKQDRLKNNSFNLCRTKAIPCLQENYRVIEIELPENSFGKEENLKTNIGFISKSQKKNVSKTSLLLNIEKHPFVPEEKSKLSERSFEVIEMQAEGLAKRLRHINAKSAVIGLSGGLDSTLALLITARAFDKTEIPRSKILTVTMPCFGTTDRTYNNACKLSKEIGATLKEINIKDAVNQHFKDINQDSNVHDITYENSQARERTQILMDLANKTNGIVIGTGDLSELALGWCTYNGDQMSMYGVNSSIPKTLVRHLVEWFSLDALSKDKTELSNVLKDILETPVSPELLPPEKGNISQKTEDIVGPYELHDFFLYYVLRWGFCPKKILFLAENAFSQIYDRETIIKWLKNFYRRFFSQQFKRSCMPDGAKVGTVSLSPRGDWRMPSDASANLWLKELEN